MNFTRYVQQKSPPPCLTSADQTRIAEALADPQTSRFPGFGQAPQHPTSTAGRIALEYTDKYKGDRK